MENLNTIYLVPVIGSLALGLVLTPAVRALAHAVGFVARPKSDRWHKRPTALLGGLAIFATVLAMTITFVPRTHDTLIVLIASSFLFVLGLIDDVWQLKPYQKLIGQILGATLIVASGLTLPWTGSTPIDTAITIFWLVGITNAINLLDNMDGLAAGVTAIASTFLAVHFAFSGQPADALLMAIFTSALLGFLFYNSNPASIFMGDCGSMFIGFFMASAALLSPTGGRARSFLPVLAVPVLTLCIPIFDTTFVMLLRKLSGRAASQGGRDHTSHRLVALGMSERHAVWMLYAFAFLSGFLALLVRGITFDVGLAVILSFTLLLTFLGVHLARVKVYEEAELLAARDLPIVAFLIDLSYKRRVFEVLLDVALIVLSYYTAYVIVFGPIIGAPSQEEFLLIIPALVFFKMATFLVMGVYRGIWRYLSLDILVDFGKAVVVGSIVSVLFLLFAFRFHGFSRSVIVLDTLILFILLVASRSAFRLFSRMLPLPVNADGSRVLIYGAGDAGELLAREILNNPSLQYVPLGFLDDDPHKHGKVIHGFRVLGGNGSFLPVCKARQVDEILISSNRFTPDRIADIVRECRESNIRVKRLRIEIETLN